MKRDRIRESIDEAACRGAIRASCPDLQIRSIQSIQPGWDSRVFLVNNCWVFRFPARPEVARALTREIKLLPTIALHTEIQVPHFEFVVPASETTTFPFVGYRWLAGDPLDRVLSQAAVHSKARIAGQVGRFLRDLHSIPLRRGFEAGLKPYDAAGWVAERMNLVNDAKHIISEELGRSAWNRISLNFLGMLDRIDWHRITPVLIHGDLGLEHILVDRDRDHRVSIIDFGDMEIGDPACDFAGLPDELLPETLEAYGRDPGPDFALRRDLYRALVPFYALEAGKRLHRADLVEEGLAAIARSVARP